jgi:hypothetical protein
LIEDVIVKKLYQALEVVASEIKSPRKEWVGLTDDDVDWILGLAYADDMELIKTIETKLKDKNG